MEQSRKPSQLFTGWRTQSLSYETIAIQYKVYEVIIIKFIMLLIQK